MGSCARLICCCLFLSLSFLSGTARCSEVVSSLPLSLFQGALLPAGTVLTSCVIFFFDIEKPGCHSTPALYLFSLVCTHGLCRAASPWL